jgi:hypothetical protein
MDAVDMPCPPDWAQSAPAGSGSPERLALKLQVRLISWAFADRQSIERMIFGGNEGQHVSRPTAPRPPDGPRTAWRGRASSRLRGRNCHPVPPSTDRTPSGARRSGLPRPCNGVCSRPRSSGRGVSCPAARTSRASRQDQSFKGSSAPHGTCCLRHIPSCPLQPWLRRNHSSQGNQLLQARPQIGKSVNIRPPAY